MSWDARDDMSGWQIGREAAQAVFRVSASRTGDCVALKKELLFWRSSDIGTHDWKVVLLRNVLKKSGQL